MQIIFCIPQQTGADSFKDVSPWNKENIIILLIPR